MKRTLLAVCTLALFVVVGSGCSGNKRYKFAGEQGSFSNEGDGKGLVVDIEWVKYKGDSIDMLLHLKNNYDHDITVASRAYKAVYAGETLMTKEDGFGQSMAANSVNKKLFIFRSVSKKLPKNGTVSFQIDPILKEEDGKPGKKLKPLKFELPLN